MSFPDDLVRYLFGHLRASPVLSPSPLTDIFAVLAPETIFREMPDIMQRRRAMRFYPLSLLILLPSTRSSLYRSPGFPRFPPLCLSLHGNANAFSLLISSLLSISIRIFETEMYELFLKEILVISLPHSISTDIFQGNETRIANAIVQYSEASRKCDTQ